MFINPTSTEKIQQDVPVVFLAGPVQGAPDWQSDIAAALNNFHPELVAASPRVPSKLDAAFVYGEQVAWEKHYLKRAAKNGCIVFWWCAQDPSLPYEPGRAYAQTTRFEFGRAIGWKDYDASVGIVCGIDPDYAKNGGGSERYIRQLCAEFEIPVATTRDELLEYITASLKN